MLASAPLSALTDLKIAASALYKTLFLMSIKKTVPLEKILDQ